VIGFNDFPDEAMAQSPYRWGFHEDVWALLKVGGELFGKSLVGRPAKWAGDAPTQLRTRKVGVVVRGGLPVKLFTDELDRYQAKTDVTVAYDSKSPSLGILGDPAQSQEQAPIVIAKLREAGVTTVALYADVFMTQALTQEATKQGYFPEWVGTGLWYSSVSLFTPLYDPLQWAHAFGLDPYLSAYVKNPTNQTDSCKWYWGESANCPVPGTGPFWVQLMTGIHGAGPRLTPETFRAGMFAAMPHTQCNCHEGLVGFGPGLYPWDDYSTFDDFSLWFFDQTEAGLFGTPGTPRYIFDGTRYLLGKLPAGDLPMFNKDNAPASYDTEPPQDKKPHYPCKGCPSEKA
jgi:hypothetical protein